VLWAIYQRPRTTVSGDPSERFPCLQALDMALGGGRKPEISHSDQGCQFTSSNFVASLQAEEIRLSIASIPSSHCHGQLGRGGKKLPHGMVFQ
jgi:hypothetical protein